MSIHGFFQRIGNIVVITYKQEKVRFRYEVYSHYSLKDNKVLLLL